MNTKNYFTKGQIDYVKGKYEKPELLEDFPDYDCGWHYERYLLPNLHPNKESVYHLGSYNFGICSQYKEGYQEGFLGRGSDWNPYEIMDEAYEFNQWFAGWTDARKLKLEMSRYET